MKKLITIALLLSAQLSRGECMVCSNDRGRTFHEFEGSPVIKHSGRDPRLHWYGPAKHWIMAVYDQVEKERYIAF